jgi:Cu/Ag efflux pump CusA
LISTILGRSSLILSAGAGAEFSNSIGWVVFGGLGIAVVFTLLLRPVLYQRIAPFIKPRTDESDQLEAELLEAQLKKLGCTISTQ